MASKPALVLVPGMSSVATIVFRPLIESLKSKHGFADVTPVNLPSVDAIATKASLKPSGLHVDIAAVRAAIESYLKDGKDVVVVAHSYGGTPSLYAISDLWKSNQSGKPGVLKAILLAASLTLPGGTVAGDREQHKEKHGGIEDGQPKIEPIGDELFVIPTGFEHVWMHDIQDEEYRSSLRPSPLSTVMTPVPETDMKAWKISYLITRGDLAMPEKFMESLVDRAREHGADIQTRVMESSHFVQISHAEEVAEWISEIA